ncbi:hypothetical protein [Streptomyces sp. NRRL S-813]|uniref:hypothetical protein n=1 Tax=Streptomyces sp. NRRL S-813 TaxID=1463919 RepID=UPI000A419497|nr:hypothetical protein [Streptomyces sp. NRRL S-813]
MDDFWFVISFCAVILLVSMWPEHDGDIGAMIKTILLTGVLFLVISALAHTPNAATT